ncbi:winged helix-turn-helix domain-containing protein [Planosporangium sp. 12N6]|uniref:winged helix-turn-helix domain-containing protein n=1 Tax=Planosporangium spinosum TaxID=3402278 RepID=UPI003CEE5559
MYPGFDEVIHPQPRLSIVALLAAADWAEFSFIRDSVGLSDSALSKHLSTLEQAGYVTIRKTSTGRRRTTDLRLTRQGRAAFEAHAAALRALIGNARPTPPAAPPPAEA